MWLQSPCGAVTACGSVTPVVNCTMGLIAETTYNIAARAIFHGTKKHIPAPDRVSHSLSLSVPLSVAVTSPRQRCWKTLVMSLFSGRWVRPVDRTHDFLLGCCLPLEAPFLPGSGCVNRRSAETPQSRPTGRPLHAHSEAERAGSLPAWGPAVRAQDGGRAARPPAPLSALSTGICLPLAESKRVRACSLVAPGSVSTFSGKLTFHANRGWMNAGVSDSRSASWGYHSSPSSCPPQTERLRLQVQGVLLPVGLLTRGWALQGAAVHSTLPWPPATAPRTIGIQYSQ